jgi:hypothetical protein
MTQEVKKESETKLVEMYWYKSNDKIYWTSNLEFAYLRSKKIGDGNVFVEKVDILE